MQKPHPITLWLFTCCLCVALMVLLGGLTRLTESGLSMVEWEPHRILPPLTESDWESELARYRASPQYQQINRGMTIPEFQSIFWLEYWHRIMGRLTGLVTLIPLLYFAIRRQLTKPLLYQLTAIFALGALQGGIGWWMVASGLVDEPRVAPYRLTIHLLMAFALFSLLLWTLLSQSRWPQSLPKSNLPLSFRILLPTSLTLLILQIALGGLVAGNDAGLVYNSFPLMNGEFAPTETWATPWFENHAFVNFAHRWLAFLTAFSIIALALSARHLPTLKPALEISIFLLLAQITLGISTLLHIVPTSLASLHQMTALFLLATLIVLAFTAKITHIKPILSARETA